MGAVMAAVRALVTVPLSDNQAAALAWADRALPHDQVRCIIDPGNGASEAVAAKLGFGLIGLSDALGHPVNVYARTRRSV